MLVHYSQHSSVIEAPTWLTLLLYMFAQYNNDCVTSWCILSVNWRHTHWPSFRKWENKGSVLLWYSCFDRSILMFLMREGLQFVTVYWNIVWWCCETISISWLLFWPLPKLGHCDVSWPRESSTFSDSGPLSQKSAGHMQNSKTKTNTNPSPDPNRYRRRCPHSAAW